MESQNSIKIEKLLFEKPESSTTSKPFIISSLPVFPPSSRLFGIFSIDNSDYATRLPEMANFNSLDEIIEKLENFFQNENDLERFDLEQIFENSLKFLNKKISQSIEDGKLEITQSKFHGIIGLITPVSKSSDKKLNLYLSQFGDTSAYLIHKTQSETYRLIDILSTNNESKEKQPNGSSLKLFTNVINGRINNTDSIFFSTSNLIDFVSLYELKKIISALPPAGSVLHISNLLSEVSNKISVSAVIVKPSFKETSAANTFSSAISTQASMDGLINTEAETEKLLTPALGFNLKKIFLLSTGYFNDLIKSRSLPNKRREEYIKTSKAKVILSYLSKTLKTIIRVIISLFILLFRLIKKLISFVSKINIKKITDINYIKTKITESVKRFFNNATDKIKNIYSFIIWRFKQLSKPSKYFLLAALILIFIFTQSIIWQGRRKSQEAEALAYSQKVKQVQEKSDKAEARIIINEEEEAKKLLDEAKNVLNTLPQNNKERKNIFEDLQSKINKLNEQLLHLIKIENPELIADLAPFDPAINPKTISLANDQIFVTNLGSKSLYKIKLTEENSVEKMELENNDLNLILAQSFDKYIYYYSDQNNIIKFDPEKLELTNIGLDIPSSSLIKDIFIYNDRLFLLDSENNQIYRYNRGRSEFTKQRFNWIRDADYDIKDATSLTIDGNIYVLGSSGEIQKFLSGSKFQPPFSVANIEPPLNNPIKIKTAEESKYLYILEPANKRLVIYNKGGKFINQYTSEKFSDLKDIIIDEANKSAYLLSNSKIYKIELKHF